MKQNLFIILKAITLIIMNSMCNAQTIHIQDNSIRIPRPAKLRSNVLYRAIHDRHFTTARYLIRQHIGLSYISKLGKTPLFIASYMDNIPTVSLLLKYGAKVNAYDYDRNSPFLCACYTGDYKLIKLLILHRAKVNVGDIYGKTPLYAAVENNSPVELNLLINYGAKVDRPDTNQFPLLNLSIIYASPSVTSVLLHHGARVNDFYRGTTPLVSAVQHNLVADVKLLLKAGADQTIKDIEHQTALDVARKLHLKQIVKLLEQFQHKKELTKR